MSDLLKNVTRHDGSGLPKQRGVVVPIVVIGLLALLAVAGLALDGSHALANKTRMQNTVDAAALAAAIVLDETDGKTLLATNAARSLFSLNAGSSGNHEMNDAYDTGDISVTVQYSLTLDPFVPGSFVDGSIPANNEWWVRVTATGFETQTTLSKVLGIDEIPTPATAVAGPSGPLGSGKGAEICDVAPIAVCEDALPTDEEDVLRVLKPDPGEHDEIGPGNYKLLRLYDENGAYCNPQTAAGANCLKHNLAGSSDTCVSPGDPVQVGDETEKTQPGVLAGPVSSGFNTRFGETRGNLSAPPYYPDEWIDEQGSYELKSCSHIADGKINNYIFLTNVTRANYCREASLGEFGKDFIPSPDPSTWPDSDWKNDLVRTADQINYNYCNYSGEQNGCTSGAGPDFGATPGAMPGANGVPGRRLLQFPVVDCDGMANGHTSLEVKGVACFFMLQSIGGSAAHGDGQIFGQYIDTCPANGNAGSNPGGGTTGPLLYKIQLYKDPDSKDS